VVLVVPSSTACGSDADRRLCVHAAHFRKIEVDLDSFARRLSRHLHDLNPRRGRLDITMFRGIARLPMLPRTALAYRQAIPQFSTQSILRRPQENDDKLDATTNDTQRANNATTSKSDISASIPFTSDPIKASSGSPPKPASEEDWSTLLSLVSKSSSHNYDNDTTSSNGPKLHTREDSEPLDPAIRFEEYWVNRNRGGAPEVAKPSDGRVFSVKAHVDVNRAYGSLMSIIARNGVRKELRFQERYEKPNQKRRRLKSERHRRRFAAAVREKVQLVSFHS
jgi:small subunit ribosomal protein MRP21